MFSRVSRSSERGFTSICPFPSVSSMSSGRKSLFDVSSPSNSSPSSSCSSRSGQLAEVS